MAIHISTSTCRDRMNIVVLSHALSRFRTFCKLMTNPYESSAVESGTNMPLLRYSELYQPLSKWLTIFVGLIVGGIGAGFFTGVLALLFVGLLGEMIGFTYLDSLLIYGLPILSLPCGMLGGLIVGGLRKWHHTYWLAMLVTSLPACGFFFMFAWSHEPDKNSRAQFYTTAVISICMILALAISLKLLVWFFAAIEKYRMARLTNR